jgi:hypothetical protein
MARTGVAKSGKTEETTRNNIAALHMSSDKSKGIPFQNPDPGNALYGPAASHAKMITRSCGLDDVRFKQQLSTQ